MKITKKRNNHRNKDNKNNEGLPVNDSTTSTIAATATCFKLDSKDNNVLLQTCGGVLVAPDLILTSASCRNMVDIVVLDLHDISDLGRDSPHVYHIASELIHPKFQPKTLDYDFMLIRLDKIVDHVVPIRIDKGRNTDYKALFVNGWGTADAAFPSTSINNNVMRHSNMEKLDHKSCYKQYDGQVTGRMLCAKKVSNKDASVEDFCIGDRGGPLYAQVHHNGRQKVIGLVSWGDDCVDTAKAGVYSRISSAYEWIKENINKSYVRSGKKNGTLLGKGGKGGCRGKAAYQNDCAPSSSPSYKMEGTSFPSLVSENPSYSPTIVVEEPSFSPTSNTEAPSVKASSIPSVMHLPSSYPTVTVAPSLSSLPTHQYDPTDIPSIPSVMHLPSSYPTVTVAPSLSSLPTHQYDPTDIPSIGPTAKPSLYPSALTAEPSITTSQPSPSPSTGPTNTASPTVPTPNPSTATPQPSILQSAGPTKTAAPSLTSFPTHQHYPTDIPSIVPTVKPSFTPSLPPSALTVEPSITTPQPSPSPSAGPTNTDSPSSLSAEPSIATTGPSNLLSSGPTNISMEPSFTSFNPSPSPFLFPHDTDIPSMMPSNFPNQMMTSSNLTDTESIALVSSVVAAMVILALLLRKKMSKPDSLDEWSVISEEDRRKNSSPYPFLGVNAGTKQSPSNSDSSLMRNHTDFMAQILSKITPISSSTASSKASSNEEEKVPELPPRKNAPWFKIPSLRSQMSVGSTLSGISEENSEEVLAANKILQKIEESEK